MISKNAVMENTLTVLLSGFALSIFFTKTGISVFGLAGLLFIVIWKYLVKYEQTNFIPRPVFWLTMLFFVYLVLSAALSENSTWAFSELGKYRHILFGGLVFIAPLSQKKRNAVITILFISAALDALTGILQHFDILAIKSYSAGRPLGNSSDAVLFAASLALVGSAGVVMLFISSDINRRRKIFFAITSFVIFMGIVVSRSRGVLIALFASCATILLFYNIRKAAVFILTFMICCGLIFSLSSALRARAISTITFLYEKNENINENVKIANDQNRFELWKGALLIFREHPVFGTGSGDFQDEIKRLIAEKKLKDMDAMGHSHNIFLQALAARGIIGLGILVALFAHILKWGLHETKKGNKIGGYVIIVSTLLTIVGGLTENNIEIHRFLAVCGFTIGLIGPYGSKKAAKPCAGTDRLVIDKK